MGSLTFSPKYWMHRHPLSSSKKRIHLQPSFSLASSELVNSISLTPPAKYPSKNYSLDKVEGHIDDIKSILRSMNGGWISPSAYDTARVALVEDSHGSRTPQFPSCLQWMVNNQLLDGSWGDLNIFSAYDRLLNTLACVITLKSWSIYPEKVENGISFIKENFYKLEFENEDHMTIGFEIVFPALVDQARILNIELPDESNPLLQSINAKRNQKLAKIPKDILHKEYTTLLFSLEGLQGLDWEKLLKLQIQDGSMLYSPASTAYAFMQTKDGNCLNYLSQLVEKFDGGVPYIYPVDIFARNWSVDRLQRLGISRYFKAEIEECVNYVARHWTDRGLYSISSAPFQNIDDTAMGFRILRSFGHLVSAEAFWNFKHGDAFCCFPRQSSESVTAMLSSYKASQLLFPDENVLEELKDFSYKFLRERQTANKLVDKWVISKDLPGEVGYALDLPYYANLPRVETRFYIEQYGGDDDVWIGKSLYRMYEVNNNTYLELAKFDYNNCQTQHQIEWSNMLRNENVDEQNGAFIHEFRNRTSCLDQNSYERRERLVKILLRTLDKLSNDALKAYGKDIYKQLYQAWEMWLMAWHGGVSNPSEAELLARIINLCADRLVSEETLSHPYYKCLSQQTNAICHQLRQFYEDKEHDSSLQNRNDNNITTKEIESGMQELLQLVLQNSSNGIDLDIKATFLTVAKSFYYKAYCSPATIDLHISLVLFKEVV